MVIWPDGATGEAGGKANCAGPLIHARNSILVEFAKSTLLSLFDSLGVSGNIVLRAGAFFRRFLTRRSRIRDAYEIAGRKRVRRANDDTVRRREAVQNFDPATEIAANRDFLNHDPIVLADRGDFQSVTPEDQRARREA